MDSTAPLSEEMIGRAHQWLNTKQGRRFTRYWGPPPKDGKGWHGNVGMTEWVAMVLDVSDDLSKTPCNEVIRRVDEASHYLLNAQLLGFDLPSLKAGGRR